MFGDRPYSLGGVDIIVDHGHWWPRSRKERLWSWPWRPWVKNEFRQIPAGEVLKLAGGKLVMNPITYRDLCAQFTENIERGG